MDEPPSLRPDFGRRLADLARDTAGEGLLTLGPDGRVVTADVRAGQLLGRPPEELVGTPVGDLAAPGSVAALRRPWAGTRDELEVLARDGRGGTVVLVARVRPLVVDGVDVLAAFLRRPERAARRFDAELGRLVTAGDEALVAVVRIDNRHDLADALGHEEVARIVDGLAARMRALLPAGATSRPASDEVAVAVAAAAAGPPEELGRRLVAELGEPVDVGGVRLAVEVSAGIAAHPQHGASPAGLLRRARQAARAARSERSGFACWNAAMEHGGPPRAQIVAEFARALDAGEVAFAYQPQLDLASGRVVAAEALVRWHHPERGLLAPGAFLPAVEQSPLMRRLALAALEDAVVQAARWDAAGLALSASVNLSVLNLLDLGIAHDLARLLARHGVPPGRLTLELTEDAIMVDPARAAGVLGGLHAMGVGLAVDDFGTGYSSLAYLQRLPVHELKIDRSFVRRVADDPRDAAIVGSIVELARGLGLRCVAEGVETADQQRVLRAAGCTTVQGYLVGRPMPAEQIGALAT